MEEYIESQRVDEKQKEENEILQAKLYIYNMARAERGK
jgi:hypothetical protein